MKENIILEKTYRFSLRIIKLYKYLNERKEYTLSNQILRSGTSIGTNAEEASGASSYKDFKAKLDIAYKEARETKYWLRLFKDSNILDSNLVDSFLDDCEEILKIIGAIQRTVKEKQNSQVIKKNFVIRNS